VSVIIYAAQCLSVAAMRRQLPDHLRTFRLAGAEVIAPVGFVIVNLIVLFAGSTTDWKLFVAIAIRPYFFALSRPLPDDVAGERLRSGADELESDAAPI
jgi:amino acid transporter